MIDSKSSRKQALKNVLSALDAGQLGAFRDGSCMYEDIRASNGERRYCSVGVLFTDAQRRDIRFRGLNQEDVGSLAEAIGQDNIEAVTGLTVEDLQDMQTVHDEFFDREFKSVSNRTFRDYLLARISEA
jgi:hypothetical protein